MTTTHFVEWQIGQSPLLITCPHDGRQHPPGTPERPDQQPGCGRARKRADVSTRLIALGLSKAVLGITGVEPSIAYRPVPPAVHRRESTVPVRVPVESGCPVLSRIPSSNQSRDRGDQGAVSETGSARRHSWRSGSGRLPDVHVSSDRHNGNSIRRLLNLDPLILFRRGGVSYGRCRRLDSE